MQIALSKPLPGENLLSLISRYLDDLGVVTAYTTICSMFGGRQISPNSICPGELNRLAEATKPYLQMTGREIAETLTAFPYFSSYVEPEARERALQIMLCGNDVLSDASSGRGLMSALTSMGRGTKIGERRFRYCSRCVAEDRRNGRPPYWRTAHQLPGVVVCWEHQCILRVVECRDRYRGFSLSHALGLPSDESISGLQESRDEFVRIAVASRDLLGLRQSSPMVPLQVRASLIEAGVSDAPGRISAPRLVRLLVDAFGETYLDYVGFRFREGYAPVRLYARGRRDPLYILLYKEALLRATAQERPVSQIPVCANFYASHGAGHLMDSQVVRCREQGIVQWRCECGMSVEFKEKDCGDPSRHRILRHGHGYREAVQQMLLQGKTPKEVAQQFGVSTPTVVRWGGTALPGNRTFQTIEALRSEYEQILAHANFETTLSKLKLRHLSIFRQLEIFDGLWQKSINQRYARRRRILFPRRNPRAADWDLRDSIAVDAISLAAARLATRVPPVRMGVGKLVSEAKIDVWSPDKMPAAAALADRLKESIDEFYERSVYLAVCNLRANGAGLNDLDIRKVGGSKAVTYVRMRNPRLLEALRSACNRTWTQTNDDHYRLPDVSLESESTNLGDWPTRDQDAVASLTLAAARLAIRVPPSQLSSWNLRREAAIVQWSPTRMPEAAALIANIQESWPEFCERASLVSARHIMCLSTTVTSAGIRRIAGKRVVGFMARNRPQLLNRLCQTS